MGIAGAILRRVMQLLALSLAVLFVTFLLSSSIPGDIVSQRELDPGIRRETLDQMRRAHGLDQSPSIRFVSRIRRCLLLDFGESLAYNLPVRTVVVEAVARTLWLGIPALVIGIGAGIWLGMAHGIHHDRPIGLALDLLTSAALALPTLLLGIGAILLAAKTNLFPLGGMNSARLQDPGLSAWLADRLHHLILPVACLTLPIMVYVERIQSAAARDILGATYIRAARARGLPRRRLFLHYMLRPSLNPVLSTAGPLLGSVLSGSLVLEILFSWPGLGNVTYQALISRDEPLVLGCVVGSTILLVTANLAADVLLLALDPRTRASGGAS